MNSYNDKKYKFGRNLSTFVFKTSLRPLIKGKEFVDEIESSGKQFIVCGNHNHVWDQFPVMCAAKVTIHWMAKQEYFEGKLAPVFKFMGCIPVDRKNNPHKSKEVAIEYLCNGSNIGLFPEGTRNFPKKDLIDKLYNDLESNISLEDYETILKQTNAMASQLGYLNQLYLENRIQKNDYQQGLMNADDMLQVLLNKDIITLEEYEESLLLPFKTGAVDMAQKTNSQILPFAVTGDYTIGNDNLMVNFGQPFYVNDCSKEEANLLLRDKVKRLVIENRNYTKAK